MRQTAFRSEEFFTQDEFEEWLADLPPSDINHYELLNGVVVMSPPAGWPHGRVGSNLNWVLRSVVVPNRLGQVFDASTGYRLPSGDTVEPDVSFISAARLSAGPLPQRGKFLEIVPNLVVEILSAPTAARDRGEKKKIYERNGVDEYWLVDVDRGEISVFVLTAGQYSPAIVYRGTDLLTATVLPPLSVRVDDLLA